MVSSARLQVALLGLVLCLGLGGLCLHAADESEQDVRDRIDNQFKVKAAVTKGGDNAKLCIDLFDFLKNDKRSPLERRIALESIIQLTTLEEETLETARIAAGMWIQVYKLPAIDAYEFYLASLRNLMVKGHCDKETIGIELFFTRNDEVQLYVQADDYSHALKIATDNKTFAEQQLVDHDVRNFAYDVVSNLQRRDKLQKRKDEIVAQLSPDPELPSANTAVAGFLLLEAAQRNEAMPYLLKSDDPLFTAYAQLHQAKADKQELGCRDFLRLGELAYELSKKAVTDDAREDLLDESNEAIDIAQQAPDADKLVDQNNISLKLTITRTFQPKVAGELQALKRKSTNRADNLAYLFTHVSFFADPRKPLGDGWSYKKDQNNEWSADGAAITFIKGDGRLTCNTKLPDDFTLSFDIEPMVEVQDRNSNVFFGVYFNSGMRAGITNAPKDNGPKFYFDFGKPLTVVPPPNFTGWTRWEIHQKGGIVNVIVNGRAMLTSNAKSPNAVSGTFEFGCAPASPFKLRNIRLHNDNP